MTITLAAAGWAATFFMALLWTKASSRISTLEKQARDLEEALITVQASYEACMEAQKPHDPLDEPMPPSGGPWGVPTVPQEGRGE